MPWSLSNVSERLKLSYGRLFNFMFYYSIQIEVCCLVLSVYYYIKVIKIPASLLSAEILGAFISVMSIWIVTGALVYLAIERIVRNDYEIDGHVMLVTSGCAVIVNIM